MPALREGQLACEYFDAVEGEMKARTYGVHLQDRVKALQQGIIDSMLEEDTVQLTEGSRSLGLAGNRTVQDQQLQDLPTSADISFDLSVDAPGFSRKGHPFKAIAQLPGLTTDYDRGHYTTRIQDRNPSYQEPEAIARHVTQETKVLSKSNGSEKQDKSRNSMKATIQDDTEMDARTESQSFPDEGVFPSRSACSCGEVFARSSDLEHHAKRYQHTQVYHCDFQGCRYIRYWKHQLGSHYKARHGSDVFPFKNASTKPKKKIARAEICEPKLESSVQTEGDDGPKSRLCGSEVHDKPQPLRSTARETEADHDNVPLTNASDVGRNSENLSSERASLKPIQVKISEDGDEPGPRALSSKSELTRDLVAAVDYPQNREKNLGSSIRRQACDRCRVWKMRCDDESNGCAPCIQKRSECKTTDQVTWKATVRGYIHSLGRQLEKLQGRNWELESRLVSLEQDTKPHTDEDDPPLLPWHGNPEDLPTPGSRYHRESPPTVAVPIRSVIKTVESAFQEAEELLCWITDTQTGFPGLLKNALRYNTEELEAAIKVREEGYGRELWFSLEDGIATEALKLLLVYFQDRVLRSLESIQNSAIKVDSRKLIDASNFARMESIAALDESSLRLAQAPTVTKSLVEKSGLQTSQFMPKSPASENDSAHLDKGPRQITARVIQIPPKQTVLLPLLANAPCDPEKSGFVGSLPPKMLGSYAADFCRGAYDLQEEWQSESLKIQTRMASTIGRFNYWTCTNPDCVFGFPACKVGGKWTLDDTVRKYQDVQYRWSFLVKSHQPTEPLSKEEHDSFMCILCIPENLPLLKYRSEDAFMKHVVSHAGQKFDCFIEQNMNFICGRTVLHGEMFDINFPSPIKDVGPVSSAAPIQRMDHVSVIPVTPLSTDATTPITSLGSEKNWQRSCSKTGNPFDKDGHVTMESSDMRHQRQASVGDHQSLRDTGGAGEAYQTPRGKPTTTRNIRQQPPRGRRVGRSSPFPPFLSSSDTSSVYSGSTYDSSVYGSKDDSSMTSGKESQFELQFSINDAEHFAMPLNLQKIAKFDCKGDSGGRVASLKPLDPWKDSESRVVADSPYLQGSYACSPGPETTLSEQLSSNPGDMEAAPTGLNRFTNHKQASLIKEDTAASGRTSSQPATGVSFDPKPVKNRDGRIELLGDDLGHGKTEDNIHYDIEPTTASEALSIKSWNRSKALQRWLKEVRNGIYVHTLGIRLAGNLRSSHPIVQPAEGLRLPKHAGESRLQANDEELSSCGDTDDPDAIIRMSKSATQHKGHDEPDSIVGGPSWGFIVKHVFPLTVPVGTYFIDSYEVIYHKSMGYSQTMNEKYKVCVTSVQMVAWIAILYSSPKLLKLSFKMLASLHGRNGNHAIEDPTSRLSKSIRTLDGQEYTAFNSAKRYIEHLTNKRWDWWPFVASFRPLQLDEVRVEWKCELRHTHWWEISREKVPRMLGQSGATDTGFSGPPSDNAGCDDDGSSEQEEDPSDNVVIAVNIVPPSKLKGYVLFGVQGSKRLQSSKTRLTQIDLNVCKDDDSFFDEMKVQYKELRGYLRWLFSIWVFYTCEFIMFYKTNPNEVMPGPEEMPSVTDMDYLFDTDRHPPILSSVFNASYYGCNKACIKSRLDVISIFHECKGRNHCGKYRVLERLPKRQRKWEIDRDEEKDEAWGLNATFGVSFFKVAVYHLLILVGPITFWGSWLRRWPADWQNASVPFFAVVVLLSLFWLPFAQNVKHKIT